jgi:hypothetical protein
MTKDPVFVKIGGSLLGQDHVFNEEKYQYRQTKERGYNFNGRVGNKIRRRGVKNLSGGQIGAYRDIQPLDTDKFFFSLAITKLAHIYRQRTFIVYEVISGFKKVFFGVFQDFLVSLKPEPFRLKMFPRVQTVLPQKK